MAAPDEQMTPGAQPARVLVVDDDRGLQRLIQRALAREGIAAATAVSGEEAITWLGRHRTELMLLDLKLQDVEGTELVGQLTHRRLCPPFIVITGQGDERVAVEMMKRGARDYLVKDADFLEFVPAVVKRALEALDKERRLGEAEEQVHLIRSVVDQGFSAVLITDGDLPDPRVVYINPAFAQATGYSPDQVLGQPLSQLSSLANVQQRLRAGLPGDTRFIEEISSYQTAEGERWGEWRVGPVPDRSGKWTHWLIIFRDITERKRLEKELIEISDQERRRLGQDLHDGLCQHLAGIELMSQVLEQKLAAKSKAFAERAGDIARHVRDAISQTRDIARGLTPVTLESEGLPSALQELAGNAEKMFGVTCRVQCQEAIVVQPTSVATHLYRIAQEAVSNAIKHGKATDLLIRLEAPDPGLRLSISDNGSGFSKAMNPQKGMGLRTMRYRAGLIGGSLTIQSGPGGGAAIVCSLPFRTGQSAPPS
jgi:PAS domain S-box-containing protein